MRTKGQINIKCHRLKERRNVSNRTVIMYKTRNHLRFEVHIGVNTNMVFCK